MNDHEYILLEPGDSKQDGDLNPIFETVRRNQFLVGGKVTWGSNGFLCLSLTQRNLLTISPDTALSGSPGGVW